MKFFRMLLARLIFWPLIIAGMAFTVFNILAKLMLDENTLRSITAYALSKTFQGQAELTWAKLSPSGEILIRGLRLRNPQRLEENLLSAENVILKLSPVSLAYGIPVIKELVFIAPRLELIKDENEEWNLRRYLSSRKETEKSRDYAFTVRETYIRDGEIIITDKTKNGETHKFRNLNIALHDFSPEEEEENRRKANLLSG